MRSENGNEKKKSFKRTHHYSTLTFSEKDLGGIKVSHQDSLVISMVIKKQSC